MTSRPSTAAPILAVLAVVLVTLGAYVGGYFWMGKRKDYIGMSVPSRVEVIERRYAHSWLAIMYKPAAKIEELILQVDVEAMHGDTWEWESIDFK